MTVYPNWNRDNGIPFFVLALVEKMLLTQHTSLSSNLLPDALLITEQESVERLMFARSLKRTVDALFSTFLLYVFKSRMIDVILIAFRGKNLLKIVLRMFF